MTAVGRGQSTESVFDRGGPGPGGAGVFPADLVVTVGLAVVAHGGPFGGPGRGGGPSFGGDGPGGFGGRPADRSAAAAAAANPRLGVQSLDSSLSTRRRSR